MIDLALSLLATLQGHERAYDRMFGSLLANVGDVDADGTEDLLVGDPGGSSVGPERTSDAWILSTKTWKPVFEFNDAQAECGYGALAKPFGDVDGDGREDMLVGPWRWEAGPIAVRSGETGREIVAIERERYARFLDIGDFDGDSIHDVVVLHDALGASTTPPPRARVHSGKDGGVLLDMFLGTQGESIECTPLHVPDEDGDGHEEWAFTVWNRETNSCDIRIVAARDWTLLRTVSNQFAVGTRNVSLAAVFEAGPGRESMVLVITDSSRAWIISLRDGRVERRLDTSAQWLGATSGFVLDDVDEDGTEDWLLASEDEGIAEGAVRIVSGATGAALRTIKLRDPTGCSYWHFGATMAVLGDVDDDGVRDFAAGLDHSMNGFPGAAFVISGRTGAMLVDFKRDGDSVRARRHEAPGCKAK